MDNNTQTDETIQCHFLLINIQGLVTNKKNMKVSYKIVINHKNVPKKDFSDVSLDDKTRLCSIATGRTNDNIVHILWKLHKLIICSLGPY